MKFWVEIFVILSVSLRSYSYNVFLIKDYLKLKDLTTIVLISCRNENTSNTFETVNLQHQGIWISVWDISNEWVLKDFDYYKFFVRLSHPHCVVVNLQCNLTNAVMIEMSKRMLFHNERSWLMFSSSLETSFDVLNPQNINVDAEIVLAIPEKENYNDKKLDVYTMYEVFNPSSSRGGQLNITQLGTWNKLSGFNISSKETKIERRRDLRGITLPSVIALTNIPNHTTHLEHLESDDLKHLDSMSRMMYRLFVIMMNMYNFKVHLKVSNIWGLLDSNGTWHGAVGMINRNEVDLCMAGLRWDNKRYGVLEQTTHAYHVQVMFTFRHPKTIDATNVFLLPFERMVWWAIIALALLGAYIARITYLVEKKEIRSVMNRWSLNEVSFSNSMLMVFGFIFQQSYSGNPLLISSRIIVTSILVFSVLIFQFYSSFIVGSLLTEAQKNIKTVKQLLDSRFEFGIDVVPYVIDNFHIAKEESTVQLYNKIMKNQEKALMPLERGLRLLKQGGFVYNTDGSYAYVILRNILTDSEKCELQQVDYVPKIPTGPAVPNKSPFKELIKISIRGITETGILAYYHKAWYGSRPKCETSQLIVAPVDILHFSSAIYILVIGIVCSVAILIIEITVHRLSKRSKRIKI